MARMGIAFFVAILCAVVIGVPICAGAADSGSKTSHCRDESIAYVSALVKCEKGYPPGTKPRGEDECFESFGPLGALMSCEMKAIEQFQGVLVRLGNSMLKPPKIDPVDPQPPVSPKIPQSPPEPIIK